MSLGMAPLRISQDGRAQWSTGELTGRPGPALHPLMQLLDTFVISTADRAEKYSLVLSN